MIDALRVRYDDDPRVVEEQEHDEYSAHVVPNTARVSKWKLAGSWWLNASAIVFIYYGALAANFAGTKQAIVGILLASLTMAVLVPHFVSRTAKSGLGSSLISRQVFGRQGAHLTATLIAVGALFYTVVEGSILARGLNLWFTQIPLNIWYAIVMIVLMPLALGGIQTWLSKISTILLPLYIVGLVSAVVIAAVQSGGSTDWLNYAGQPDATVLPGWLRVYIMYMAVWLLLVNQMDFSRFGKVEDTRFNSQVSFGWIFYVVTYLVNGVVGIYLSRIVTPDAAPSEVGIVTALIETLGIFGVLAIVVSQLRINVVNMYIASLNSTRIWSAVLNRRLPRFMAVVGIGVLAYLLMLTNVFSYISVALNWLAIIFVAWVGIYFTHYAFVRFADTERIRYKRSETPAYDKGLISWAVATLIGGLLIELPFVAPWLAEFAPIVTLVVAIALQAIFMVRDNQPVGRQFSSTDRLEEAVDDLWATRIECARCSKYYVGEEMDIGDGGPNDLVCLACENNPRD